MHEVEEEAAPSLVDNPVLAMQEAFAEVLESGVVESEADYTVEPEVTREEDEDDDDDEDEKRMFTAVDF